MPVDIKQFLPTFIDECMEMLQETEETLLMLNVDQIDIDKIHLIFRFMHSIKGNSIVFNFIAITELTHTLEAYLDKVRQGNRPFTAEDIELFLIAVDALRSNIVAIKKNEAYPTKVLDEISKLVKKRVSQPHEVATMSGEKTDDVVRPSSGWDIVFSPPLDFLSERSDPIRLFSALKELGELSSKVDDSQLPYLEELNPRSCYLKWKLQLYTNRPLNEIIDIFSWSMDEKDFSIQSINEPTPLIDAQPKIEPLPSPTTTPFLQNSVRINTEKIDHLINLIGELVITQSVINQIVTHFEANSLTKLIENLDLLEFNSRELQTNIMRIRLVPIEFVFNRFPRMVHDLAQKLNKKVQLSIQGEQTEIDKNMIEKISDPLLHLVRNAIDHGIDPPEERKKLAKPLTGLIQLHAYQEGSHIIIDVTDDGQGLNKEKINAQAINKGLIKKDHTLTDAEIYPLIFQPGFSTRKDISDISGRGVGLDVVYKNIHDLNGEIEIITHENQGTTFRLRLPLTLAIMDCQLVYLQKQIYAIPLISIAEIIVIETNKLKVIDHETLLYALRDEYVPIIHLAKFFAGYKQPNISSINNLIILEIKNKRFGLIVDEILSQQQIVIKNFEDHYRKVKGIAGVTILGDGKIAFIMDVNALVANAALSPEKIALHFANPGEVVTGEAPILHDGEDNMEILSFLMAGQEYGIDMAEIKEIRILEETTELPNSPSYLKGVINVRGTVIPIIDLNAQFTFSPKEYDQQTAIIILFVKSLNKIRYIGAIVEQVLDHYMIKYKEIKPFPNQNDSPLQEFVTGVVTVDEKMIILIDGKKMLASVHYQETVS